MFDLASTPSLRASIAGCGAITAVGAGVPALARALWDNRSGLQHQERFNSARFQSAIVGAVPDRDETIGADDPAFFLAAEAIRETRGQAREVLRQIPPERIGLVLSTTKANIEALERVADGRPCSDAARRHVRSELLAVDLASAFSVKGPIQSVSLACASGLSALQQGARLIRRGEADAVFVVGVDHLSSFVVAGFTSLKAIDPDGCRPFDRNRRGLSPGEAGAAILLVRSDQAPRPAVTLLGWGGSNDANHMTGPARDGSGLARAIQAALRAADLQPKCIQYVHAHGTGTPYNDSMESAALNAVFGECSPAVGGSKGMLGHTLGAAGVVESIVCALALQEQRLPGTPRLETAADDMPSRLVREPEPAPGLSRVLKLSTGFGGTNSALIFAYE